MMYKVKHNNQFIKLSWLSNAAFIAGILFFQTPNLAANSGWHEEAFSSTISYESMTEKERAEAGFVAAVDSGELTGAQSWTYTLRQGGDYQ
ncbi:MAG: hypothetical protein ACPGJU_10900, partial [Coraliomargarita sp.]